MFGVNKKLMLAVIGVVVGVAGVSFGVWADFTAREAQQMLTESKMLVKKVENSFIKSKKEKFNWGSMTERDIKETIKCIEFSKHIQKQVVDGKFNRERFKRFCMGYHVLTK